MPFLHSGLSTPKYTPPPTRRQYVRVVHFPSFIPARPDPILMDEAALIRDAQRGDVDAYNSLVLHFQTGAYNVAYRIMGDLDSAADATQEAFIAAYRSIHTFRGGSFKAWLMRIVTNQCYDELRRRKRRPNASLDALYVEDDSEDASFASHTESPESHTQRRELQDAINECLQGLPDDQRAVTVLRDVEGFSYEEIAAALNVADGTVKSRLARARIRLRDCLQGFAELLPATYRLTGEGA